MTTITRPSAETVNIRKKKKAAEEPRSFSPEAKKSKSTIEIKDDKDIFYKEENTIDERDAEMDYVLHMKAMEEMKRIINTISQLKNSKDPDAKEKIEQLRQLGMLQIVVLKKMNRIGHFRVKKAREVTTTVKLDIDQHRLQLQNLTYEVMHFQREITKCLEFKSKDEELNLVSVEEFYQDAPEDISKPVITKNDMHQQTLARLDWELELRQRLSEKLKISKENMTTLAKDMKEVKGFLDSLQPLLNNILLASKPVQEHLSLPFDEQRSQLRTAQYLPHTLYVLYRQSTAYGEALDKELSVKIEGDLDLAKTLSVSELDLGLDSDSDTDEQLGDSQDCLETKGSSKHHRKGKHSTRLERGSAAAKEKKERIDKVLHKHPLAVCMTIKCAGGSVLVLKFEHLIHLNFVTVKVALTVPPEGVMTPVLAGELVDPDQLLNCLYPGDEGTDSPNPSNYYLLNRVNVPSLKAYLPSLGLPYHWVQWLSGLQFLSHKVGESSASRSTTTADWRLSATHMEDTVQRLRLRVSARVALQKQLALLERCSVHVSAEYQSLFPVKVVSKLTQWTRSTYEDFTACVHTQAVISAGLVDDKDLYYTATLERSSAKLEVQVVISPQYPLVVPLFFLSALWKGTWTALNDLHVREMEQEVNVHYDELVHGGSADLVLTNQIERLLVIFDLYLEAAGNHNEAQGPLEISKEKIFTRKTRGPGRKRPYCYHAELGYFKQR